MSVARRRVKNSTKSPKLLLAGCIKSTKLAFVSFSSISTRIVEEFLWGVVVLTVLPAKLYAEDELKI